jgi:hypothetical protein
MFFKIVFKFEKCKKLLNKMASKGFDPNLEYYHCDTNDIFGDEEIFDDYYFEISNDGFQLLFESDGGDVGKKIPIEKLLDLLEKKIDILHYCYHMEDNCRCPNDDSEKRCPHPENGDNCTCCIAKFSRWIETKVNEWIEQYQPMI